MILDHLFLHQEMMHLKIIIKLKRREDFVHVLNAILVVWQEWNFSVIIEDF